MHCFLLHIIDLTRNNYGTLVKNWFINTQEANYISNVFIIFAHKIVEYNLLEENILYGRLLRAELTGQAFSAIWLGWPYPQKAFHKPYVFQQGTKYKTIWGTYVLLYMSKSVFERCDGVNKRSFFQVTTWLTVCNKSHF